MKIDISIGEYIAMSRSYGKILDLYNPADIIITHSYDTVPPYIYLFLQVPNILYRLEI